MKAVLLLNALLMAPESDDGFSATVGMSANVEIDLAGAEAVPVPNHDDAPLVLRVVEKYVRADGFRYQIEWYGLEPGEYFLTDYLQRKDGTPIDTQQFPVTVTPVLEPGQILPNTLEIDESPGLGGYRTWMIVAGVAWVAGLLAILFVGRKKKMSQTDADGHAQETLADRLKPLVTDAIEGRLSREQHAELEMALVAFWRRRLGLEDVKVAGLIAELREHDEAGPLLQQMELWLHKPASSNDVDIAGLLNPYRQLPADALDAGNPSNQ